MKLLTDAQLNRLDWDSALQGVETQDFLQSFAWGEFHTSLGHPVWRFAIEDAGILISQLLVIQLDLGYGQHLLYSPHGTFINKHIPLPKLEEATALLMTAVKELGAKTGSICFRIDPCCFER